MRRLSSTLLLVVAVAIALWLATRGGARESGRRPSTGLVPPGAPGTLALDPSYEAPQREPVLATASGANAGAVEDRIRALEAEVERLTDELSRVRAEDGLDSAAEIQAALRALDPNAREAIVVRTACQRELWEQMVERFPTNPGAVDALERLSGSWIVDDPSRALDVLERFAARVGMAPWRQDRLAANALNSCGRIPEADRAYQRVIAAPDTPEHERWSARFFAAHLFMHQGSYDEARARFEALIELAGDDPGASIRDTVEGARLQLEQIRRLESER